MCVCFEKESWSNIITKCSLVLSNAFYLLLRCGKTTYVTALMFLLFVAKIFVWIKQTQIKVKCHKPFKIGSDTISVGAFFVADIYCVGNC